MMQAEENSEGTVLNTNKSNGERVSEKHSLFLGDLSIYCDEKDIAAAFASYGNIVDIRIQRSKETSRALSYGFIEFETEESAAEALREMNYFLLKGRPLRIRRAAGRTTPVKSTTTPHDSAATVYVRFLTLEDNVEITEESLRTLFNQYGPVFDCAIKKVAQEQKGNRIKGYAFVSFDSGALAKGSVDVVGVDAALRVCTELRNRVVENVRYRCELGNRLQKQAASMGMVPALIPAVVPCAPLGGYLPGVPSEYASVPPVMYPSQVSHEKQQPTPPQIRNHPLQVPYQLDLSRSSSDNIVNTNGRGCTPPMMMSPYSSNPSTPTNHQLRMAQLAQQQQQQINMSYQQQQYQQQGRAPHPGYTPVPTPTNQHNNNMPSGKATALQVLQQNQQCQEHGQQGQSQQGQHPQAHPHHAMHLAKHPQDHQQHHPHQGHGPHSHHAHHAHTPTHQGQSQSQSNYQAQLLAQAQAQLHAQAIAQAALHAQQTQQQMPLPQQFAQFPPQAAYPSRSHSGYNSGASTPVSVARMAQNQQQPQYGHVNMNNVSMQMVTTPDGVMMMVPVSMPMSMPVQGPVHGLHSTGYPAYRTQQQAYTPRAYTPTAYAQQQAYMQQGQQQGILKELSCSQYFAQKGIRLSIKTQTFDEHPPPVMQSRSHSAENTPREAYLQRKMNSTPRRSQYNNNIYINNSNSSSNITLPNERTPVSRRGSNNSVNTTSLYIGDLSIEEEPECAESAQSSEKCEKGDECKGGGNVHADEDAHAQAQVNAVTPTTGNTYE